MALVIKVDYDISKAEAKMQKLKNQLLETKQKTKNIGENISDTTNNIENSKNKQKELNAKLEESGNKLERIRNMRMEGSKSWNRELAVNDKISQQLDREEQKEARLNETLRNQQLNKDRSLNSEKNIKNEILAQTQKMEVLEKNKDIATQRQATSQAKALEKEKARKKESNVLYKTYEKTNKSIGSFTKKLAGLAKRVLIFSVFLRALRKLKDALANAIGKDSELSKYVAQIKASVSTIGTTLFQSLKPVIEWILQKTAYLTMLLSQLIAKALGKDVKAMASMAKNSAATADNAEKALASFDTLQKIETPTKETSGTQSDFTPYDMVSPVESQLSAIMILAGEALMAIGLVLVVMGVSVLVGLSLIAVGALMFIKGVQQGKEDMTEQTKAFVNKVLAIGATLFLVIGIILCVTGNIPLGVAMLIMAGVSLVGLAALNWNYLVEKVVSIFRTIKAKVSEIWEALMGNLKGKWKGFVNFLIFMLNSVIEWFNAKMLPLSGAISGISKLFGKDVPISKIQIPHIPYLAKGAVIPGGSPFLATLGDQPKGQTNIEAPLETLVAAFKAASAGQKIEIEFTGSLAQLARILAPEIKTANKYSTIY